MIPKEELPQTLADIKKELVAADEANKEYNDEQQKVRALKEYVERLDKCIFVSLFSVADNKTWKRRRRKRSMGRGLFL